MYMRKTIGNGTAVGAGSGTAVGAGSGMAVGAGSGTFIGAECGTVVGAGSGTAVGTGSGSASGRLGFCLNMLRKTLGSNGRLSFMSYLAMVLGWIDIVSDFLFGVEVGQTERKERLR